ncbi:beta-glucosidase BglX [Pseudomonas akapageensis]|uniref:beta-glucosidase BglX n=1 Tax=Pseudomonas akapageensis TaxID=2609961 RepID=UPI001409A9CB|nr:beta-glucosidase BglX [Pseudomonas akapageensis]
MDGFNRSCVLALLASLHGTCVSAAPHPALPVDKTAFINQLLEQMTPEEKVGQLRQRFTSSEMPEPEVLQTIAAGNTGAMFGAAGRAVLRTLQDAAVKHSRLKIPLFFSYDVIHGHRTIFPISLGLASSWDMDAIALSGRIAAKEASSDGMDMTFAPMVDISRDPRWGRISEGFGEDTYLVSRIAGVMTKAFQGESPSSPDSIMACVKHFALYGAVEGGRDYNSIDMSMVRMYQDYLPPYRAAIDAGAGSLMTALTTLNGVPATANTWLLQDLLRRDWGFKGLTLSDHGAVAELIEHGVARDGQDAARLAIRAGINMSMSDTYYGQALPGLLRSGEVSEQALDNAVRHVLNAKYDMGLFDDPYRRIGMASDDPTDAHAESRLHRAQAREVARKTLVLLKNRDHTLPLKKQGTIALIGPLAKNPVDILGSWHALGQASQSVTVYDGLKNALGNTATLLYAKGANITEDKSSFDRLADGKIDIDSRSFMQMREEALKIAWRSDVIVAVLGESRGMSHEGASRTNLNLPGRQSELLSALKATGKPLVLVVMNGRPLTIGGEHDLADAVLETWFSGTEGGNAIADVLVGDYNPSGKLPITFPRSVGQIPTYYNHLNTGRPLTAGESALYKSQYFDLLDSPLYPFGYGLSYTDFSLSDITLSTQRLMTDESLDASVTVKNTGARDGETVVQLYIQDISASISRPVKELKGFQKIMLKAGEERTLHFTVNEQDLKFYNSSLEYAAEPGEFNLQIGLDSQNVKQQRFEWQCDLCDTAI